LFTGSLIDKGFLSRALFLLNQRSSSAMLPVNLESAKRHYTGNPGQRYHHGKRMLPDLAYPWVARLRAEKLAPYIQPTDAVFEYGTGAGWNLADLNCRQKIGYDVSDFLRSQVESHGIHFVTETASIPDDGMDIAVCHHTLEHTLQPAEVLHEIKRLLKPGGHLLLFVPYEKERRYQHYHPDEPNHHLYSWNVQTLGNLVVETGFEWVKGGLKRFRYDRFAAVWAVRFRLGETGYRLLRRALLLVNPEWEVYGIARKPV
jgi:SAM-dependent methyltransferase